MRSPRKSAELTLNTRKIVYKTHIPLYSSIDSLRINLFYWTLSRINFICLSYSYSGKFISIDKYFEATYKFFEIGSWFVANNWIAKKTSTFNQLFCVSKEVYINQIHNVKKHNVVKRKRSLNRLNFILSQSLNRSYCTWFFNVFLTSYSNNEKNNLPLGGGNERNPINVSTVLCFHAFSLEHRVFGQE